MDDNRKIRILQDAIRIKTVNTNEGELAVYLAELFGEYGIEVQFINYSEGRSNLMVELKGNKPGKVLAYTGHLDVVSAGDATDWRFPPYAGIIRDGRMYGRGTTDMKGGLVAMALSLIQLKLSGKPFRGTLRFIAVVGEEIGMLGSKQITEEHYIDDIDAMIIGEPSGPNQLYVGNKGSIQYEIHSIGRSAHSSTPDLGINSLLQINELITVLDAKFNQISKTYHNQLLGNFVNVFSVIEGGDQINSVPRKTVLKANARTIPEFDNKATLALINQTINEVNTRIPGHLELHILQNNPAVERSSESPLIQSIARTRPKTVEIRGLAAATDASNFTRIDKEFDLAIYGPGDMALAHLVNESVPIAEYLQFVEDYTQIALDYLS